MNWKIYKFKWTDNIGTEFFHEYIHESEEQARRELIHTLNALHRLYPVKIELLEVSVWEPSPFSFE